jgi:hypothetical protein
MANKHMKYFPNRIQFCGQIIVCFALIVSVVRAAEPTYEGRPLSEWLLLNSSPSFAQQYSPEGSPSPAEAIRQIGTNGIPTMLDILGVTSSNSRLELGRLKSPLVKKVFRGNDGTFDDFQKMAVDGFAVLGTNAECAVPQLSRIFNNFDQDTFFQTAQALAEVGPRGFAVLTNALNSPNSSVRNNIIWVLGRTGGVNDSLLSQILIKSLQDPDPYNRGNAAIGLAGKNPAIAIPAVMTLLDSTNYDGDYYALSQATTTLAGYGAAARAAAPRLFCIFTNVLEGTNEFLIRNLTVSLLDALRKTDPPIGGQAEQFMIKTGPLNAARINPSITQLPNGKELIAGGYIHTDYPIVSNQDLRDAEIYDPATRTWTETGKLNFARNSHKATLLPDGKVLIENGYGPTGVGIPPYMASKELYDPVSGTWSIVTNR